MSIKKQDQNYKGPVPVEDHYDLFKVIEGKIKDQLGAQKQDYLLIGLRVAYDVLESSIAEPGDFPYSVEFGYLEEFDNAFKCSTNGTKEELLTGFKGSPIPIEMLEELYEFAKEKLTNLAETPLAVGLGIQYKTPMFIRSTGIACSCNGQKGKKWRKAPGSNISSCKPPC